METIKIELDFFQGQAELPLYRLGELIEKSVDLFVAVCGEIGIPCNSNDWKISGISSGSLMGLGACSVEATPRQMEEFNARYEMAVVEEDEEESGGAKIVELSEVKKRASYLKKLIHKNERIRYGLHKVDAPGQVRWIDARAGAENKQIAKPKKTVDYDGGMRVAVTSLVLDPPEKPYAICRDLAGGQPVKCFIRHEHITDYIAPALKETDERQLPIFVVEGRVRENLITGTRSITASVVTPLPAFDEALFKKLRGTMPNLTGKMTTGEFIEWMRDDDE